MLTRRRIVQAIAVAPLVAGGPAFATLEPGEGPRRFEIRRSGVMNGARVNYRVVSEDIDLFGDREPIGRVFSFSYLREDVTAPDARPVIFIFNGGPGASSVWLHLGVMGPRTVRLDREVDPSPVARFTLENNRDCLLDVADLVFVDPVGTGFSRIVGDGKPADFYGVEEDAKAMAQFVDAWLTRHDRWASPKYLMGESYGTVRAAEMQRTLMGGPSYGGALRAISLDGVVLIGSVLRTPQGSSADLDAEMLLPNLAATAWYHGKVDRTGRTLGGFVDEVCAWAEGTYAQALRSGSRLPPAQREAVAAMLAGYTGLSGRDIVRADLRIGREMFATTLLEREGLDAGIYDSRYTLPHARAGVALDPVGDDPAMARYTPGFAAAWHHYLLNELGVRIDRPYGTIVWTGVNKVWRNERTGVPAEQSYAVDLALAMRRNPRLRLLVASGYYDLATPFMAAESALAEAGVPLDRVRMNRYASGHMAYFGGTGATFLRDVRALVRPDD